MHAKREMQEERERKLEGVDGKIEKARRDLGGGEKAMQTRAGERRSKCDGRREKDRG